MLFLRLSGNTDVSIDLFTSLASGSEMAGVATGSSI